MSKNRYIQKLYLSFHKIYQKTSILSKKYTKKIRQFPYKYTKQMPKRYAHPINKNIPNVIPFPDLCFIHLVDGIHENHKIDQTLTLD